ncbi:hypothetical protein I6N90_20095 [Paenibacillus sp. GSMTC-2017]|uniref:hypothetical protein n=1 Tax=Paenibacillus sp. GSMTC-2017 TaxID=2794350 RepID=UPI0018D67006|nr:hypothetical protein [Paenibacillus sp. GSMTC-2017]MBH5320109.1 hypothetical protein [Paenibacillus sp. GSMTC-2017]
MSISFVSSIISRLKREIEQLEQSSKSDQKKKDGAQAKLKQLQRDIQKSLLPSDLSNKMTRIEKLNVELSEINKQQLLQTKQLADKKAELQKHISKQK